MDFVLKLQNLPLQLLLQFHMIVLVELELPVLRFLQLNENPNTRRKGLLRNGERLCRFRFWLLLPEKLEIVTVVKDAKLRLVFARSKDVLTRSRSASDHLNELDA